MTQDPLAISADDILREGNIRGASPFETAAAVQRWRDDVLAKTRSGDGEQWANKVAKFDSEALAPVLEYLRSDALKQGATPEEVKGSTSMWTPGIQRLKAPIVAGGQQIGSFDLVMGDSPTAIAYSFNGPGNERVAIPLPKPTPEAIDARKKELAAEAERGRGDAARAKAMFDELTSPPKDFIDALGKGAVNDQGGGLGKQFSYQIEDGQRREREALLKLENLNQNPQLGFLSDQLEAKIMSPELRDKFGGVHLGEDFQRGLASFYTGSRVAWNDLTQDTPERQEWEKIHQAVPDIYPGTNQSLKGPIAGTAAQLAETAGGQVLPLAVMAGTSGAPGIVAQTGRAIGLGMMGVTSYGATRADSAAQSEYLKRQADLLQQAGHTQAAADTKMRAEMIAQSTVPRALATAATEIATEMIFAEEKLFAGGISRGWRDLGRKTLTSGWQNAVEEASAQVLQGNVIDPASGLQQGTAGDVAQAATVGALFGGALTGLTGIGRAFNKGDWATPPAEGPRQAATPPVEPPPPAPEPEAQGAPDPAAAQRQRAQAAAQAAAPDPATKQAVEQIFATAEAAAKGDPIPVTENQKEVPRGQEENRQGQGQGRNEVLTPATEAPLVSAGGAVAPISEQPSENLAPRSTQTVEPRPERQGRDTSARDAWDEKYGTQVRGGRTHNDDGTPYQPTVFDETVPKIIDALSGKTFDEKLDAVGTDTGAELGAGVRQLLNDGWVWDNTQGRMVDPKNRGETPRQALTRIRNRQPQTQQTDGQDERQRQGQGQGQGRNEGLLSPEPPAQNNEPVPSGQTQDGLEVPSLPGEATGTGSSASVSEPSVTPEAETVNSENITRTGISIPPELTNSVAPIQGLKSSDPNILRLEPGLAYRTVSRAEVASLVTEGYHLPDPNLQGRKKKSRGQTTKKMWSRLNEANPEIGYKPGSIVMVARESDIPQQTKGRATPVDAIKIAQFQNGAWQLTTPAEFLKEEDAVNSENGTTPPEESPTTVTDLARSTVKASRNVDPEEASVNSEKPPLYWKGDQIELTGNVTPDGFEEFRYVDGAKAGQLGVRMTDSERVATTAAKKEQFQQEQEDFRRLRELQQEPKPTTVTDLATSTRKAARNVDPEAFKQRVAEEAVPPEAPAETSPELAAEEAMPEPVKQASAPSPMAMKEQKKFLLSEIDKALEEAPDSSPAVKMDDALAQFDASVPHYKANESAQQFNDRREQELRPLIDAFGNEKMGTEDGAALSRLRKRMAELRMQELPKVTIEIPGDGTFRIINTKEALAAFKKRAASFPTTLEKPDAPRGPSGVSSSRAPAIKTPKTLEERVKGTSGFVSEDKSLPILNLVLDTGEYLVATNGAMLVMTDAATPKGRSPALREPSTGRVKPSVVQRTTDAKGKVTEQTLTVKDFPDWKQVVPRHGKILFPDLNVTRMFTVFRQALSTVEKGGRVSVDVVKNPDGTLGFATTHEGEARYQHNIQNGAEPVTTIDAERAIAMFEAASALGAETLNWHYVDVSSPNPTVDSMVFVGKGVKFVMMPMRSSDATPRKAPERFQDAEAAAEVTEQTVEKRLTEFFGELPADFRKAVFRPEHEAFPGTTFVAILGQLMEAAGYGQDAIRTFSESLVMKARDREQRAATDPVAILRDLSTGTSQRFNALTETQKRHLEILQQEGLIQETKKGWKRIGNLLEWLATHDLDAMLKRNQTPSGATFSNTLAVEAMKLREGLGPNELLLLRVGSFYEAYGDQAQILSRHTKSTVTKRGDAPMASIAYHALHGVIHRLTAAGISVAVAEQVADGKRAVAERYPADPYGGESPMADAPTPAGSPTFDRARAGDDAAFDELDRMKRARYGDPPPVGRVGADMARDASHRRFTTDSFAKSFEDAFAAKDFDTALELIKQTDKGVYVPFMKALFKAEAAGDANAAAMADWMRHIFSGTRPANAAAQPPPQPAPPQQGSGTAGPAAQQPPPAPPPPPPSPPPRTPGEAFNMPALVRFLKEIKGSAAINRLLKSTRGMYRRGPNPKIELHQHLFKDPAQALKTFAHEIGHFIDYVQRTVKGSRLAARLVPMKNFGVVFAHLMGWSKGKMSPIAKLLRDEARALSRVWRGDFNNGDPYRDSSAELYADFMSALLTDPDWTMRTAPQMTNAFFAALEQKPAVEDAYNLLQTLLKTDTLLKILPNDASAASRSAIERVVAQVEAEQARRHSARAFMRGMWGAFVNRYDVIASKAGGSMNAQRLRRENFGSDFATQMEMADGYALREKALLENRLRREVYNPLAASGIDKEDLATVLKNNRILNERTATGAAIEANPNEARKLFTWMVEQSTLDQRQWKADIVQAADADLYALGARLMSKLHFNGDFERVTRAAQRQDAPDWAEKAMFAFDVSGFMMNPQGITPVEAQQQNDEILRNLGPQRAAVLQKSVQSFYDAMRNIVMRANDAGLFRPSLWRERIAPNLGNYVPFMVLDYLTGDVNASIKQRFGTFRDILPAHLAGALKAGALLGRIARQQSSLTLKDFFTRIGRQYGFAQEMTIRDELSDQEAARISRAGGSSRIFWDKGQVKHMIFTDDTATWVDQPDLAEWMKTTMAVADSLGNFFKRMWTVLSFAFTIVSNPRRQILTTIDRGGVRGTAHMVGAWKLAREYRDAHFSDNWTPRIRQLITEGVLPPPMAHIRADIAPDEFADELMRGVIAASNMRSPVHMGRLETLARKLPPINWTLDRMMGWNATVESIAKIGRYEERLKAGDNKAKAVAFARLEGIPNPGVNGGKYTRFFEPLFPFLRVHLQGLRATKQLATQKETRGGFLLRVTLRHVLSKGWVLLGAAGVLDQVWKKLFGDDKDQTDIQEFYRRITPYKIENEDVIPLAWKTPTGWAPVMGHQTVPRDWVPVALRLGFSEEGRFVSPMLAATMFSLADKISGKTSGVAPVDPAARIADAMGNLMAPDFNPFIGITSNYFDIFDKAPPRDTYRGQAIATDDEWNAGYGSRAHALTRAALSEFQILGTKMSDATGMKQQYQPDDPFPFWNKMPGFKALVASDNYAGVRDDQTIARDDAKRDAVARELRGPATKRAVGRMEELERKGQQRRSADENAEYAELRKWYRTYYQGTEKNPALMSVLKKAAAGDKTVDVEYARKRLEETATDALKATKAGTPVTAP